MKDTPAISVIVPTYQRCAAVRRLLQAFCRQTHESGHFEVVISIDGSDDGTREMVQNFQAPYPLRHTSMPNRGRAAACNAGIEMARGSLLVFLDDDMQPAPGFLAAHREAHNRQAWIGVLGAVPVVSPRLESSSVVQYTKHKFNQHLQSLAQSDLEIDISDFYSGNFSLRREIFSRVGLFDEAFKIYGNEDLELFWRLKEANVELTYCPQALAYQEYDKDPAQWARDNIAEGHTSVLLACKHPQAFARLILATYNEGLWIRRAIRTLILTCARHFPASVEWLIALVHWLDRRPMARIDKVYYAIEDTFYWLGVQSTVQETRDDDQVRRFMDIWALHYETQDFPLRLRKNKTVTHAP